MFLFTKNWHFIIYIIMLSTTFSSCQSQRNPKLLYDRSVLNQRDMWIVEQKADGEVKFSEAGIEISDSSGCTVWFKPLLKQPLNIEYQLAVIDNGGPYDRVSDMNVFWLATDPEHPDNIFFEGNKRSGQFRQYDSLRLYYVGAGGHNNTRTRFRRYDGKGNRPLEAEHDLSSRDVLLTPNIINTVRIEVDGKRVKYLLNGNIIYDILDENPLHQGWFGFRTWRSHQLISDFKILE